MMPNKRMELARQLWFWQSRDVEGAVHEKAFPGQTTYSETDWDELLIESEQEKWLKRADRVLALADALSDSSPDDRQVNEPAP